MSRLWFVCPIHGRQALTAICLRQLRRTCDILADHDIDANAVVIGDDENLAEFTMRTGGLGFATVRRDNRWLSRKYNDGIQLALDPDINPEPATHVIPIGSDNWIDHRAVLSLPAKTAVICFKRITVVREDGQESATQLWNTYGGTGVRIYPRELVEPLAYRPADEDRKRGCDTSIITTLARHHGHLNLTVRHLHDAQIVDWKSADEQLNPYANAARRSPVDDPFTPLAGIYPDEAIGEMRDHYAGATA